MKILALLLLLGHFTLAGAAEWTLVYAAPDGGQYFYDASKLTVNANEITYWKKVLFKTPQPYKSQMAVSALYRERIHCTEHTVKPLSHIVHGPAGAIIEQVAGEGEATPIIPESIGDLFEAALCPQVRGKRDEVLRKTPEIPAGKSEAAPLAAPPAQLSAPTPPTPPSAAPAPTFTDQDLPPGTL